jgi:branched-chain amino acid transport system ATP-binding protein
MASMNSLLKTERLSKHFGGLQAVEGVDLDLNEGEIRAIIGPNGAGKTTLVSLLSGRLRPSSGRIHLNQKDITSFSASRKVQFGIVYTFQVTSLFFNLSCYENVAIAVQGCRAREEGFLPRRESDIRLNVRKVLEQVGIQENEETIAGNLAYGHQRLLEVAMGLASRPKLLILDEPTQGLAESEIKHFCSLIRGLSDSMTILLIEHNMQVVLELAEQITVMDQGRILAEGTPSEIEANIAVQESYLGG